MTDTKQPPVDHVERLIAAATRVVATYRNFEDGNGEPCPDIAQLRAALAASEGSTDAD